MSTHPNFDKICVAVLIVSLLITVLFMNASALGVENAERVMGYEDTLFDTSKVHTINIVIDDWDEFLETATSEEYTVCSVIIDNEAVRNVAIRGKGNTSLSSVATMGSSRYSFKIEFDQYDGGKSYHGLDKLCLNNLIQDNTYMKDYLTYRMMDEFGADAPLCSYAWVTVNGEDWGLYLAVEAVEDSFMQRVYGGSGDLYKPDSMSFGGGGPGNGKNFNMDDFMEEFGEDMGMPWKRRSDTENTQETAEPQKADEQTETLTPPSADEMGTGFQMPPSSSRPKMPGGMGMGSSDVKLKYTDDDPDSYSNIFNNAKTGVTYADKIRLIRSLKQLSEGTGLEDVLDMDEVLRYFVVHNFTVNSDSYTGSMIHNYYLHEADGRLAMIPWDYNLAFGSFQGSADATDAVNDPIDDPLSATADDRPMWGWIVNSEEYLEQYHELFAEFLDSVDIIGMIDETREMIAPYVEKDPTAFCTYEEFEQGVDTLRSFCSLRIDSIRGQLDGAIPSTDDGQSADSSALIAASNLNLSDLGSMNNGGGFGGGPGGDRPGRSGSEGQNGFPGGGSGFPSPGGGGSFSSPDNSNFSPPDDSSFSPSENSSFSSPESGSSFSPPGNGGFPGMSGGNSSVSRDAWLLLGASVLTLMVGLVIVWRFRRYA
ncbi:MAG: CotH kinase family protein [Oscillospiraceae bacterium]|nr:CotH kinase family protein [Oscillospiraceae bacterium]